MAPDKTIVTDSISQYYQIEKWGEENKLVVTSEPIDENTSIVKVKVVDSKGTPCLDSKRFIRFEIAGDGTLLKNLGTAGGSSKVQAANGNASIKVKKGSGKSVVAVKSENMDTQFINI